MRKFLLECFGFAVLVIGSIYFVLNQGDGYTDAFYARLTTPRQTSLILGSSRAAQGVVPSVLDSVLSRTDVFNFAFTIGDSPYGPTYYNAIRKKLDPSTRSGIFVVTVDPWSISSKCEATDDTTKFRELRGVLAKTKDLNSDPNFHYLLSVFSERYINLLTKNPQMFLHADGWLEVTVGMDSSDVKRRTENTFQNYRGMAKEYCYSQVRADYLVRTVSLLKKHGSVYLVRLPAHPAIMEIEGEFMPDFNSKIAEAIARSDGYLDMTNQSARYTYIDGNHLYRVSSKQVSNEISDWIRAKGVSQVVAGSTAGEQ